MMGGKVAPLFELRRAAIVESIHYGAIAAVDSHGKLIYSPGDPDTVAFLRSSAKPFFKHSRSLSTTGHRSWDST